ncbi:MAG: EVE domain-containing protein [Verrucomicrobiae bacterium]|nr:EVE domain-containing protein [Verrucomicrobiae bacterium]
MSKHYWLVKQEPEAYAWSALVADGRTAWTGVRNFQARNNLRAMKRGDPVLYYHSVTGKAVVGVARVDREAYPDPTVSKGEGDWSCVDLVPVKALKTPVTLDQLKADPATRGMALIRQSRLSVTPLTAAEYARILELAGTTRR